MGKMLREKKPGKLIESGIVLLLLLLSMIASTVSAPMVLAAGATTSLHIIRYAEDGTTILDEKTVSYQWLEENLSVQGDGITHYYHQGPVFEGDSWDPEEMINLKDKGAVRGTDIKDLCELVGGMAPGDEVMVCAIDGYCVKFAYTNVYRPPARQGSIVLCWYKGEDTEEATYHETGYPGNDAFSSAIQLVFMAKTKNPEGKFVFGNDDMRVCLPQEEYQHFYEGLPSTNGLSVKWVSEIRVYAGAPEIVQEDDFGPVEEAGKQTVPRLPIVFGILGNGLFGWSLYLFSRRRATRTREQSISPTSLVNRAKPILVTGIAIIVTAVILSTSLYTPHQENIEWDVTLNGISGETTVLTYDEIRAMPPYVGNGGFFTSVGYVNGPYRVRGVPIADLCNLVGGISPQDIVFISARDGYSTVLDYDQVMGDFITYDPTTMREVAHGEQKLVLTYELDGRMLSQEEGRPVRLAIAGDDNLLTEGLYWVKWVEKIEIIRKNAPDISESQ